MTSLTLLGMTCFVLLLGCGPRVETPKMKIAGEHATSHRSARPLDPSLIALDSREGRQLLQESDAKQSFIPLVMYFTTQDNLGYCGVASATMVLNALPLTRPASVPHDPFTLFTQSNVFTPAVRAVASPERVSTAGMTLDTLGLILRAFPITVQVHHAHESTLERFKRETVDVLKQDDQFVLVNYLRRTINQESGGHISPIAAYNERADRFLILDVSRYKYVPVWVTSQGLWDAMNTGDPDSKLSRGYVVAGTVAAASENRPTSAR
jgi:hypothetical protein